MIECELCITDSVTGLTPTLARYANAMMDAESSLSDFIDNVGFMRHLQSTPAFAADAEQAKLQVVYGAWLERCSAIDAWLCEQLDEIDIGPAPLEDGRTPNPARAHLKALLDTFDAIRYEAFETGLKESGISNAEHWRQRMALPPDERFTPPSDEVRAMRDADEMRHWAEAVRRVHLETKP